MSSPSCPEQMRLAAKKALVELKAVLSNRHVAVSAPQAATLLSITEVVNAPGATFLIVGLPLSDEQDSRWKPLPMYGTIRFSPGKSPQFFAVWAAFLGFHASPIWYEARVFGTQERDDGGFHIWMYGTEQDIHAHGLKHANSDQRRQVALNLMLLEKHVVSAGRPFGSTERFRDAEHFRASISAAIKAIQKQDQKLTAQKVASYLDANPKLMNGRRHSSTRWTGDPSADPARQLRRDQKTFGFKSWAEVLAEVLPKLG